MKSKKRKKKECNENKVMTLEDHRTVWETNCGGLPKNMTEPSQYDNYFDMAEHVIDVLHECGGSAQRMTNEFDTLMNFPVSEGEKSLTLFALQYARIVSYCTWFGEYESERGYILVRPLSKYWQREFIDALNLVISLYKLRKQLRSQSPETESTVLEGAPLKLHWLFNEKDVDIDELCKSKPMNTHCELVPMSGDDL